MLVWEALLGQVPLEGRGPSETPVLGTSYVLAVAVVSQELKSVQE